MTGQESLTDSDAAILRNVREGKSLYDPQVARLRQIQRQYGFTFAPKKTEEAPQPAAAASPTPSRAPAPAVPTPSPTPTPTPSAPAAVTEPQMPRPQPPAQSPAPAPAMGLRNVPNPLPTTPPEFKNDEEARTWLNAAARSSEIRLTQSQHALRERLNDQAGDDLSRALASAGDMLPGLTDLVSGVVQENLLPGPLAAMLVPGVAPIYAASKLLGGGPAVSDDAAQTAATAGEGARKVTISTRQIADWAASQVQTVNFEREREDMVRQQLGDAAYEFPPLLRQEVERRKAAKEAPYDGEGTARRNALTYEIYNRNKDLEQAFEGRPEYYQGGELVQRTPDIFGASPVTISNPVTGNTVAPLPYTSTGLAIAGDPLNIAAGAFGGLSKLRLLSRAGSRLGIPLGGIEKGGKTAGAALTGFADRLEDLVNRPRIDPATGQPVARSLNLSAVSAATGITAGTVLYQMDDSGTLAAGVGAVGLAPLALRGAGFTFQKVGSSAGKWSVIAREMAAGPLGSGSAMKTPATQAAAIRAARPAVAEELLATGNVPPQYAKYMRTATDDRGVPTMSVPATRGADSTLKRVAQNREAPPAVRIAARAMDRSGLTGGFRMLDDAFSGGVSGAATGLPFAAIAPEPEYAGAILGGSALFGTLGGPVGGRTGRRKEFTDSDVARMMVDIKSRGGDPFTIVQQAKPKELATAAAMQGIMANKGIDFMPLRADEYGAMVPEAQGGRGYHTTKDKDGRQTYFVNMGHYADFDGRVRLSDIGDGNTRVQVVKDGQDPYSFVVPESRKGRLRVKDGDEVKAGQMLDNTMSNSLLAAAHEFMHPIMLSDMFAGPHKPVLHGLMYDMYGPEGIEARKREYVGLMVDDDIASGVSPGSRVEYTAQEQSDMATGKRTPADIMRERGVVDKTRDELIADKIAEMDDYARRELGDRNAWIADEMLSEYWRSYGNEIDINKLRGSKSPFDRARAAEGVSVFNQRLLGLLGMKFDPQTGKPLTIPSQLFRDNPLIDTPVIRRRVNETVRLYDQYLQGLEDAGAVDAPGTPLPKTDNANDYARDSRVVMPEDPTTGVRDDDFAVVGPDGNARFREPDEIKAIEEARAGQVADLASREGRKDAAEGEFGLHVDDSGRKILRGPKLPNSFYLLKSFPEHAKVFSRQLDEVQDRGGVVEVTFNRVGEKKDNGSWKPTAKRSAAESVTRRMIPFDREVTKTSQINVKMLDLDAVNVAAMKMINEGALPAFNNDLGQLTSDLKTYLANHRAGRPGETGLTVEKRNILNALVGTGTAVQRKANALVGAINPRGAIRSVRIDRIVRLKNTAEDGLGFDNDRVKGNRMPNAEPVDGPDNNNRMPQQIPRGAQGMPDAVETLTTDQLQRQYEENQGYLGLSTLGMREGRPVRGGAAQTRELLRRNDAISAELQRRGVREEDPQLQRALQRRGQAMPDAVPAGDQGVAMPKGTVTQLTDTARKAIPQLPKGASSVPKLVIRRKDKPDAVVDGGNPKSWKDYTGQHWMPLPNVKLDKVKGVSFSKQDIYDVARTDRARAQADAQQSVRAAALAAADPMKFVDPVGYSEIMRASGVVGDILIPPSGLKLMLTDPAAFVGLLDGGFHGKRTVPGTRAAAMQGLDGVTDMRQLVGGQPSQFNTALHHYWGTLSKQLDVVNQEAAWMRTVLDPAIIEAIDMSVQGKFNMTPKAWEALVAKALDGTKGDFRGKGNNAKANANSFYKALAYHNGRWDEVAALYANNNAIDMRAQFNALGHGKVGMKNKVQGFVGLSFGVKGSVLDRWRFVDLYLPDVMKLTGAATPEQYFKYVGAQKIIPQDPIGIYKNYGTLENGNPAFSLALYNSLDSVAQVAINNSPELRNYLGAHADPGGLHWATWNAIKNEAVGHSSLDITKNFVRKYGRDGTASDFAQFMRTAEGFVEGSNDAGQTIRLSLKNGAFNYLEQ